MGNDASTQAGLLAAKAKMSGALSSVEETLNLKNNDNARTEPKTKPREWNQMHQETAEVHQQNQSRAEKRKAEAKARWEANLKRKQELAAKK